jgi:sulfopyruvate decarboxylase TPP-binding subunit
MFSGSEVADLLVELGFTHVVTIPDSTIGSWHAALSATPELTMVRVCREGEAWAVAGGLFLGGATPLVLIQCTGLFESGDALRNVVHDWKLPIYAMIGYRSYLDQSTIPGDTCLVFTEPVLNAWAIDYELIVDRSQAGRLRSHCLRCRAEGKPGAGLIAEGKA